jgi:hypothetical protein
MPARQDGFTIRGVRSPGVAAFQVTVTLGAFLLFLVQPMAARFLLPWFGGAPSVWSTCLLFFQAALLAGYGYAHVTRRLGPRRQAQLHLALLVLAIATLPITPSAAWKPAGAGSPAGRILLLLAATVGLPYLLLSATAPMVQDWFAHTRRVPYRLYALSNLGSLMGLVAYPAAVERFLPLQAQSTLWSAGFVVFCGVCAWSSVQVIRIENRPSDSSPDAVKVGGAADRADDAVMWTLLSFCGSGLLLAATNELCQNVAVVPLLWIVPLTCYLVTFILSFAGLYRRWLWAPALLVSIGASAWLARDVYSASFPVQLTALLGVLMAGCMVCHGELVRLRPAVSRLTRFYLAVAAGGSAGGLAVALVAPVALDRLWEFPLFAVLPLLLLLVCLYRDAQSRLYRGARPVAWTALSAACIGSVVAVAMPPPSDGSIEIARTRNFYGILSVADDNPPGDWSLRRLRNGRILHGAQFMEPQKRTQATTYYGEGSGIEIAIRQHSRRLSGQPLQIGVVGLGAGTIAAWGEAGDRLRFFEINPAAVDFARRYFTFLADSRAAVDVVGGDARLSIEREVRDGRGRRAYDVLAVDAFSGDAIPVHLLTREALALYAEALREDGVLAIHVTNHYLDLKAVVRGLATQAGRQVVEIETDDDYLRGLDGNTWMLVTGNASVVAAASPFATRGLPDAKVLVWTDAFSSLLQVLKR